MNNENKECKIYTIIGSNYPYCGKCHAHIQEHQTVPTSLLELGIGNPKTSEQVWEGAVRKIEPLPEPYSDDHFRKVVVNKINELIKIINKN